MPSPWGYVRLQIFDLVSRTMPCAEGAPVRTLGRMRGVSAWYSLMIDRVRAGGPPHQSRFARQLLLKEKPFGGAPLCLPPGADEGAAEGGGPYMDTTNFPVFL